MDGCGVTRKVAVAPTTLARGRAPRTASPRHVLPLHCCIV